jgi:hypothetical protein
MYNYRHKISASGWFDTASCDIVLRARRDFLAVLQRYLGARVAAYVDNPSEPVWEGLISRLSIEVGGGVYTVSLDAMSNRVTVQYTDGASGVSTLTTTTAVNNTTSQAVYGIKQGQLEMGFHRAGGATKPNALRDTLLAAKAWPQASITPATNESLMHLEMVGFFHTLEWNIYNSGLTASTAGASTFITGTLLPGLPNGATFFNNAVFTQIQTNTLTVPLQSRTGQTYWEMLKGIQEFGDGTNKWVVGIAPTDTQGQRVLYYRQANTAIEYSAYLSDGMRVRNVYGKRIPAWIVKPDRGLRIVDAAIAWSPAGDDPRTLYITGVDYDAETQAVTLTGGDDITTEGVFNLAQVNKFNGQAFGATPRIVEQ